MGVRFCKISIEKWNLDLSSTRMWKCPMSLMIDTLSIWSMFQMRICTCNQMFTFGFSKLASYDAPTQCLALVVPPSRIPAVAARVELGSVLPFFFSFSGFHILPTHCLLPSQSTTLHTPIWEIFGKRAPPPCRLFSYDIRLLPFVYVVGFFFLNDPLPKTS